MRSKATTLRRRSVDENQIHDEIIKLFMSDASPEDDEIHSLADSLGLQPGELESHIYHLFRALLLGVGKHNDVPDDQYDAKELEAGRKVELEHTDNKTIAEMIAKDHLAEIPDYYTRLLKMEKEASRIRNMARRARSTTNHKLAVEVLSRVAK